MNLEETIQIISPLNEEAMKRSKEKWNHIAKPLDGLGRLEELVIRIAGITGNEQVSLEKKALIVMCADNGVVEEGVTQTDSSVTAIVTNQFSCGKTSACLMSQCAGVDVFPVDIGVQTDTKVYTDKVAFGTKNMLKEPAMTQEETKRAMEVGIRMAKRCKEKGYDILLTGEMGIGNTTTSSAVAAVLLDEPVEIMTGKGAGLSVEGLARKREVISRAIQLHGPDKTQPLDVIAKVGGLDIAGLTGVFLGGAACGLPVVIDGFISAVAALAAVRMAPKAGGYFIPSHLSREPGMQKIMQELGAEPYLNCDMKLGEGTGAVALMPLLDMTLAVYHRMYTFDYVEIETYQDFEGTQEEE